MSDYDWSQFHVHMYYLAPIDEVFRRFATSAGMESFYVKKARFEGPHGVARKPDEPFQEGDTYKFEYVHDFRHPGRIMAMEPNRRVKFTFGMPTVEIRFREVNGATHVDLHQTGCPTDEQSKLWLHMNCRNCWIYFLTNLRSVLAGGPDVRDFENPQWNDSVSVGWNPATGPGG